MCLLALLYRVASDAPVVVGANREEFYARGGDPPQVLGGAAVAGVDPLAGGTWLGVNAHGLLVAVTNRRKSSVPQRLRGGRAGGPRAGLRRLRRLQRPVRRWRRGGRPPRRRLAARPAAAPG